MKHTDHRENQTMNLSTLMYLNDHPLQFIKQLVNTINDRLSTNSSSEKVFIKSKSYHEDALNKSGYKTHLEYKIPSTSINRNSENRKRKIVLFNPPYNQSVSTNVAQTQNYTKSSIVIL